MIAVVLAAGRGQRMGGPKALLDWRGEPLLLAHLRAALRVGCDRAIGVVRAEVASHLAARVPEAARLVVSDADDALGPAGSLAAFCTRAGAIPPDEAIAIAPVDLVPAAWRALDSLAAALVAAPDALAARSRFAARGGHPVLVWGAALAPYAQRAVPPPLRELLSDLGERAIDVAVSQPEVVADLDTPDDLAHWREPRR